MKAIGGFFSLELPLHEEYHKDAIKLNTGRNCLEYILRAREYVKVYIPFYTCGVVLEPFRKLGVAYDYYSIDNNFELVSRIELGDGECVLYTNYYGLKQRYIETLVKIYGKHLIIDNTQAFYAVPLEGVDTFYTCRKFFGVPDGAYLYSNKALDADFEQDVSFERLTFLTKRIDISAEAAYVDFREESDLLVNNPIRIMSALTKRLMESIDYEMIAEQRKKNYFRLHQKLEATNKLKIEYDEQNVPLIYPYYVDNGAKLRDYLISKKIYIARYWPNVLEWTDEDTIENQLALNLLPIPIDQRYGKEEMDFIVDTILFS